MSEHIWVTTEEGTRCIHCNKFASIEADDLRAKLVAAETKIEKHNIEYMKLANKYRDTEAWMKEAEQDRDNLRAQLNATAAERDFTLSLKHDLHSQISRLLKTNSDSVKEIDSLQARLTILESKIRKAYQDSGKIPSFLPKTREKLLNEVIDLHGYRNDQYWTIVGIIANYPTLQKSDESVSDAVRRLAELLEESRSDQNKLLVQLAEWKDIAATEQGKWAETCVDNDNLQARIKEAEIRISELLRHREIVQDEREVLRQERDLARDLVNDYSLAMEEANKTMADNDKQITDLQAAKYQLEVDKELAAQECHACSKHKDNLQAAYGVVRGELLNAKDRALSCVAKIRYGLGAGGHGSGMITEINVGNVVLDGVVDEIEEVFESITTPTDAGDRVQILVESLDDIYRITDRETYADGYNDTERLNNIRLIAKDALVKYRGGNDGE